MPPRHSDPAPRSAECQAGRSAASPNEVRALARAVRREKGLILIDPSRIENDWHRRLIEQYGDEQLGRRE